MRLLIISIVLIFCIVNASSLTLKRTERIKRSNEDNFFNKVKSGVKNFAYGVKDITIKSVEEVKNLFSKDRNVGDYRLNQIDVRFGEDETETSETIESTSEILREEEIKREKRDVNEQETHEIAKNIEDQFESQIYTTEGE